MAIRILRRCHKCGELKDREKDFPRDETCRNRRSHECRACYNARYRAAYRRRKEARKEATV